MNVNLWQVKLATRASTPLPETDCTVRVGTPEEWPGPIFKRAAIVAVRRYCRRMNLQASDVYPSEIKNFGNVEIDLNVGTDAGTEATPFRTSDEICPQCASKFTLVEHPLKPGVPMLKTCRCNTNVTTTVPTSPPPLPLSCTKCGMLSNAIPYKKYCGNGSDKDDHHSWRPLSNKSQK